MEMAENQLMKMTDDETGEVIFHNKKAIVDKIVIEVLIAFFQHPGISKIIEDARNDDRPFICDN
jgi:hypothetical protein